MSKSTEEQKYFTDSGTEIKRIYPEPDFSDEEKAEIETAMKELDAGNGVPHEKVMSQFKGKYL